jgi:Fur family ferric uptake transcriptional regulator
MPKEPQASKRAVAAGAAGAGVRPASVAVAAAFAKRAEATLRENGGRMTRSRRALIGLIAAGPKALAPRELHRELRRRGVVMDLVSVYRNVGVLLKGGLLHRVLGSSAVRPCAEAREGCHHAMVCTSCGEAREFNCAPVAAVLDQVRREMNFKLEEHVLELRGLCGACAGRR